ncbi:hypothetical protein Mapa_006340 [Marchantia paleacea]|nr:hypothetical protein Mapa_006340 [Marchantia paleacea]
MKSTEPAALKELIKCSISTGSHDRFGCNHSSTFCHVGRMSRFASTTVPTSTSASPACTFTPSDAESQHNSSSSFLSLAEFAASQVSYFTMAAVIACA